MIMWKDDLTLISQFPTTYFFVRINIFNSTNAWNKLLFQIKCLAHTQTYIYIYSWNQTVASSSLCLCDVSRASDLDLLFYGNIDSVGQVCWPVPFPPSETLSCSQQQPDTCSGLQQSASIIHTSHSRHTRRHMQKLKSPSHMYRHVHRH